MGKAKDIVVKPIKASVANDVIKKLHYSGKKVNNSQLHFGVFFNGKLEGVMQFGPSIYKQGTIKLVSGTRWNDFIELNRMAFSEILPKNSESRAIGIALRLIKKTYKNIEWVISFSDATQCGDGTIYRASGFVLTGIKKSNRLVRLPNGDVIHLLTWEGNTAKRRPELGGKSVYELTGGRYDSEKIVSLIGGEILQGYQLRYIYFLNKSAKDRLSVPILPFNKIDEIGAGMYKGVSRRVKGQE